MQAVAAVLNAPRALGLERLDLLPSRPDDAIVAVQTTAISTGTERLLYTGAMPPFPGLGYPLVPGYEAVGRVIAAPAGSSHLEGRRVFVPGSRGFEGARGLFGAAASRLSTGVDRLTPLPDALDDVDALLLPLAATAHHALTPALANGALPELIVGHGVLGRLLARLVLALGGAAPTVWETQGRRREGGAGYRVIEAGADDRRDYRCICDASGDPAVLDALIARLQPGGEVILAGFYSEPVRFAFPPAFMREARLRIAAEWKPADMAAVLALVEEGRLDLSGLITHVRPAEDAQGAYAQAFEDPDCLKMRLDWSGRQ